jgi:succinate dehydrogenase hydrophobic anchor subunit
MPNGLWLNLILKNTLSQWWANMASRVAMYSFNSFSCALLWWWDSGGLPAWMCLWSNQFSLVCHADP